MPKTTRNNMEPAAEVVKTTASVQDNLGVVIGALSIAVMFIVSKWQTIMAFIRNKPRPKAISKTEVETMIQYSRTSIEATIQKFPEREEIQEMIKEHDAAATVKTTLLLRDHEKSCMQCLDTRFREQAKVDQEYRKQEAEDRKEFRREMLETTRRIHERIDVLAEKK